MAKIVKSLLVLSCLLVVTGCKLAIVVTSGGDVVSESGSYNCSGSRVCEININSDDFHETFTAIPAEGYEFEKWQGGPGFNCPESTDPICVVSNTGLISLIGEPAAVKIASDQVDHLMPIFKWVGMDSDGDGTPNRFDEDDDNDGLLDEDDPCPFNPAPNCGLGDFIVADGKIWFQPDSFIGETWDTINAVCGGGLCSGVLAGYNMNGWTWATPADLESLLNSYGSFLYPAAANCEASESFFNDGWRKTNGSRFGPSGNIPVDLFGFLSGPSLIYMSLESCRAIIDTFPYAFSSNAGAWFYQAP